MSADFYIAFAYSVGGFGIFGLSLQGILTRKKLRQKQNVLKGGDV